MTTVATATHPSTLKILFLICTTPRATSSASKNRAASPEILRLPKRDRCNLKNSAKSGGKKFQKKKIERESDRN